MRYAIARHSTTQREAAYRIYVTDSLFYMGQDMRPSVRYYDLVSNEPADDRTAEEIVVDIINGAGLSFGGE